jgi:hypothetical protein
MWPFKGFRLLLGVAMKKCIKCGEVKELSEFYGDSSRKSGLHPWCKDCKKTKQKHYQKTTAGKIVHSRANKSYCKTLKGKKATRKKYEVQKENHPEKEKARVALNDAVRVGKIKKGLCVICKSNKVEAHHPDYQKPLDIIWLCKDHHTKLHNINNGEQLC